MVQRIKERKNYFHLKFFFLQWGIGKSCQIDESCLFSWKDELSDQCEFETEWWEKDISLTVDYYLYIGKSYWPKVFKDEDEK